MIVLHCTVLYSLLIWYILVITDDCSSDLSHSVSLSELAHGERPNISLKLVSSFRLLLALGPSLPAGLEACRAVACKHENINQNEGELGICSNCGEENNWRFLF